MAPTAPPTQTVDQTIDKVYFICGSDTHLNRKFTLQTALLFMRPIYQVSADSAAYTVNIWKVGNSPFQR